MNGIKKTALFLSGLEWNTVDLLLGRLEPEAAKAVRREMLSLDSVSVQDSERVAKEFLNKTGRRRRRVENREWRTESSQTNRRDFYQPFRSGSSVPLPSYKPFYFLRSFPAETIADEMVYELSQTVAVVLAHLPASKAGEVLAVLPNPMQLDVAKRLTNYEPMDEQLLRDIETALKERFLLRQETETQKVKEQAVMQTIFKSLQRTK